MRKIIFASTLALATLFAGGIYAQNQKEEGKAKHRTEYSKEDKNSKKEVKPRFNPFEGLNLTSEQQEKLKVLRQGLGNAMPKKEKLSKEQKKSITAEQKKQMKAERKAKKLEVKKNYLTGVKEILTPDQYVMYLENIYINTPDVKMKASDKRKGIKEPRKPSDKKKNPSQKNKKTPKAKSETQV